MPSSLAWSFKTMLSTLMVVLSALPPKSNTIFTCEALMPFTLLFQKQTGSPAFSVVFSMKRKLLSSAASVTLMVTPLWSVLEVSMTEKS